MREIDPVLKLLMFGVVFFTFVLIFVEWRFKDDGQIFQTFAGLLAGFGGALLLRVKPTDKKPEIPPTVPTGTQG